MTDRTCVIPDCERLAHARWMCTLHYQRAKHAGLLPGVKPAPKQVYVPVTVRAKPKRNGVEPCSVDGCDEISKARLMCAMHYSRWRRHGDPAAKGRTVPCIVCGSQFVKTTGKHVCCSLDCRRVRLLQYGRDYQTTLRIENPKPPVETFPARCMFCHADFDATRRRYRYCSTECHQGARRTSTDLGSVRRKERLSKVRVERFSKWDIFERDNWICGLCNEPIDREATFPNPYSVSLDHIIPVVRGGDHIPENCQAAHLRCNSSKNGRLRIR